MSEFSSFYLQVHIEKKELERFLLEPSKNISDYNDWEDWFLKKNRMCGNAKDFIASYGYHFSDIMSNRINKMAEHASYDDQQKLYILDNINIGSSFEVFMPYMIVFRDFSKYVIRDSTNNFMVIYPYWWGDSESVSSQADAYIEFSNGDSLLTDKINQSDMEFAANYFDEHANEFAKEFYKEHGYF